MRRRRFLTMAAGALAFPAFAATPLRWRGIALGAEARLDLAAPPEIARPALAAALAELRRAEALFSLYDPASTLSRLNRDGRLAVAPAPFLDLLDEVDQIHGQTDGLFDPTVQPVWQALARGEGDEGWDRVGWDRVARSGAAVRLGPGQRITLNGIAQGFATDRVVAALRAHGLTDAFVDIGEQAALGPPCRLGLVDPVQGPVGTLTLSEGALATSSPGATPLGADGHILHPRGPARPLWSTVTVEARTATLADGLSTALCLMDLPAARRLRRVSGVRRVVLVDADGDVRSL
ncbi:MAG: FAD:protein FMN transferase [Pseudomonadota bacterium]